LIKQEIKKVFEKGFFHLLGANGLILIAGFASQLLVARFLEPSDLGRIRLLQTFTSLASLLCALGFNISIIRLCNEDQTIESQKSFLYVSLLSVTGMFVVLFSVLLGLNFFNLLTSDEITKSWVPAYSLVLLPLTLQAIFGSYFQGINKIKEYSKLQSINKISSVLIIVGVTYFLKFEGYLYAVIFSNALSALILYVYLPKEHRFSNTPINFISKFKRSFHVSKFAMFTNFIGFFYSSLDILFLNNFSINMKMLGQYSFAITLISVLNVVPQTIQQIAYPQFASISGNQLKWQSAYKKYNQLNHFVSIISLAIVYFAIPFFVVFIFKEKYEESTFYFRGLAIAWTLTFMNCIKDTAIMGKGAFNYNFIVSLALLIISIPVYFFAIKYWSVQGAVVGKIILGLAAYVLSYLSFTILKKKSILN
jgi:O-antigen/teichoic acid export membrane protein